MNFCSKVCIPIGYLMCYKIISAAKIVQVERRTK